MRTDPHSFADLSQAITSHLALDLTVDFASRRLAGRATKRFESAAAGPIDLDSRGLHIASVVDSEGGAVAFELAPTDPVLGERLRLMPTRPVQSVTIEYTTAPDATGLMWLEPSQTDGGEHPFVLS